MAKFVIECPVCGKYAEASTGFFAKKKIDCTCGHTINVRTEKLASKFCPHCGNNVVFDQTKGEDAICPVCHEKINTRESMAALAEFTCPSCSCKLSADKSAISYTCPLCDTAINVQERIAKEEIKNKGLASVIKYEGGNDTFVWKHPIEDFNLGSQLIVHESQEALFFRDGKALDLFGAGRYTLATQNLPLLENLYKLPTNANEIFHSEVYFINMTTQMGVKWGTDSKVRLFDPASGLHVEIGACGNFNIRVADSRKLILKLVGTANELTQNEVVGVEGFGITFIVGKFRALIMNKVKANLARAIKENNINILEIDEYIDILSEKLQAIINETLVEYGLIMPEFYITSVLTPDDLIDGLTSLANHLANLLRIDLDRYDLRCVFSNFRTRRCDCRFHTIVHDEESCFTTSCDSAFHDFSGQTMDLNIHLDCGDTFSSTGYLKVHISKEVFQTLNIRQKHEIFICITGYKTTGNTCNHLLNRYTCSHQ